MQQNPALKFSISCTTRPPRPTEVPGRDYFFITPEEFQRKVDADEFLEHAQVFDYRYGTARAPVEQALAAGQNLILEIDWQGAQQIRAAMPQSCSIFILPPSREALRTRLTNRHTDSAAVIERRLADAVADMSHYTEFDYVVVNDEFERAVDELARIIHGQGAAYASGRPELAPVTAGLLSSPVL
jgi:guanylate kinase